MVRFKNRWLLIELLPTSSQPVSANQPLTAKRIWSALKDSALMYFGDVGWGALSPSLTVKYFSPTTHICIVRVARAHERLARAAATLLSAIEGLTLIPHVVHVSGTIKHAQMAAIAHNRVVVARYRARAGRPAAYQDSYDEFLDASTAEIDALQD